MITNKIVLVLGAGASMPYQLPSGSGLRALILAYLHNSSSGGVWKALRLLNENEGEINQFKEDFQHFEQGTIDAFLEKRPQYLAVGKKIIAATLLPCEKDDFLFREQDYRNLPKFFTTNIKRNTFVPLGGNWYPFLFQKIEDFENLPDGILSIVTFNYDRTLEYYLFRSLLNLYEYRDNDEILSRCVKMMEKIPILHVYGQLGMLKHQVENGQSYVPFGSSQGNNDWAERVENAAKEIHLIGNERESSPQFKKAHQLLLDANYIYFLGFGFDRRNLARLLPKETNLCGTPHFDLMQACADKCHGTAKGLTWPQRKIINEQGLSNILVRKGNIYDSNAYLRFQDLDIFDWLSSRLDPDNW